MDPKAYAEDEKIKKEKAEKNARLGIQKRPKKPKKMLLLKAIVKTLSNKIQQPAPLQVVFYFISVLYYVHEITRRTTSAR